MSLELAQRHVIFVYRLQKLCCALNFGFVLVSTHLSGIEDFRVTRLSLVYTWPKQGLKIYDYAMIHNIPDLP